MDKKFIKILMGIVHLSTAAYIFSNLLGDQILSNYLSPAVSFASGLLIIITMKYRNFFSISWILLALVGFFWGTADTIWMVMFNFFNIDPEESVFLLYLYLIPNLLILASGIVYFKRNLVKWHTFQLAVDAVITFIIIFITIRFSLGEHIVWSDFSIHENISNVAYLITDVFSLLILIVLILSARVNKLSKTMKWIIAGYMTYVFTDMFYVYSIYLDLYQPNAIIDTLYILAITFFGTAAYVEWKSPSLIQNPDSIMSPQNAGGNTRLLYFVCIPILMSIAGILNVVALIGIAFFLSLYYLFSGYIQSAIKTEGLLVTERTITERLEELVSIRTSDLMASYKKLEILAITDTLSTLYNRRYFLDKLDELVNSENTYFSLYYLDLDHFKIINDIHGHEMGDVVLKIISERFIGWQRENIIVGRVGGDEFAVIHIHDALEGKQLNTQICNEIMGLFDAYVSVGEYIFEVRVSVGISRYPYDAKDRDSLVKYADLAMYQAKKNNEQDKCVFYSHQHGAVVERKNRIELLLKTIDYDKEFSLHFQPQFSIDGKLLLGVEALIRWQNPEFGFISPVEFIKIAEETGCIIKIGKWVIDSAFKQITQWNSSYNNCLQIGINLSPLQFDSVDFFPYIIERIEAHQVNPAWIDFEITESSAMNSGTIMEEIFTALTGLGVQISIDDFGTGYSSLSYLKRFDIDRLKIAKELVDHIVENQEERVIIKAIILMAKGMGLSTIAEGVETKEQLDILSQLECDAIQGYYFSKPLTKEDFEAKYLAHK